MKKIKKKGLYALFGCMAAVPSRYEQSGYVGLDTGFPARAESRIELVDDLDRAFKYDASVPDGHGSPDDWAKLFNEDYGFKVHPVKVKEDK